MDDLAGKVAVVTGAASGIGLALAKRFAAEGMSVALSDVDGEALERAVNDLEASGSTAAGFVTDVGDRTSVFGLRDDVFARFGTAHVVCNNAGIGSSSQLGSPDFDAASWRRVVDVDLFGIVYGVEAFLPQMLEQDDGHIVNTASRQGLVPSGGGGAYCGAKSGAVAVSEVLHAELSARSAAVGVSVLCPGGVRTGMLPPPSDLPASLSDEHRALLVERYEAAAEPEEVADLVVRAVRGRHLYVLTHRETLDWMGRRIDRIAEDVAALGTPR
jgi:NAD(P)-dependent dehydrogenase (short-subunit alcohol dehydrogenase family)